MAVTDVGKSCQQPCAVRHSSNEPGELSQRLCHDDSAVNIVMSINVIEEVVFASDNYYAR